MARIASQPKLNSNGNFGPEMAQMILVRKESGHHPQVPAWSLADHRMLVDTRLFSAGEISQTQASRKRHAQPQRIENNH